ncbi:hypothetical protein AB0M29_12365 [Streptomyces sp. NPDC051976]|uniref:hypothetical protein n=1 Tax=Streptomyces sp. NPDC051976 TaxID=3154947 RepID=UPI003423FE2B
MTRRTRTALGTTALCGALLLATAACGSSSASGPTAAQAGTDLQTDFTSALKAYSVTGPIAHKPPYTTISDASKDVPCGSGKATRVYTAEQRVPWTGLPDPASMHTEVQTAAAWFRQYQDDLKAKNEDGPDKVSFGLISDKRHAHVVIVATRAPNLMTLTFNGTSDCLRTS